LSGSLKQQELVEAKKSQLAPAQLQHKEQQMRLQLRRQRQVLPQQNQSQQEPNAQQDLSSPHKSDRRNGSGDSGDSFQRSNSERAQRFNVLYAKNIPSFISCNGNNNNNSDSDSDICAVRNVIQPAAVSSNVVDLTMNATFIEKKAAAVTNAKLRLEIDDAIDLSESKYPTRETPAPAKASSIKMMNSKSQKNTNGYESDSSDGSLVF
jgi:hypothetical protein